MFLILVLFSLPLLYALLNYIYGYWKRKGVTGPKPTFFVGNIGKVLLRQKSLGEIFTDIYNKYQNAPFVGVYKIFSPVLIIRDPEIIKDITVKEFSHFTDNDHFIDKEVDPLFGRNPFVLHGEEWKIVRNQLTPSFTSGKMKSVFALVENNCKKLVEFVKTQPNAYNSDGIEAKSICMKFTLSNVVNCSLGLEGFCFEDPNSQFNSLAKDFLKPESWDSLKQLLLLIMPSLSKILNVKTSTSYKFTDIDIAAHVAGFFLEGYETSAIAMSFMLYEIAENPGVQTKLREEITRKIEEHEGNITYECLQEMIYLDAVLSESLRMHPVLLALMKFCTSSYTYNNDGKSVTIDAGTSIILPVFGLHYDPKYFTDPETFWPERFIGENKEKIVKYSYLPFGEGPRICLGRRFGMMQVKLGIAHIIKSFEVFPNSKTQKPLKLDPTYFLNSAIGGLWVNFKEISGN